MTRKIEPLNDRLVVKDEAIEQDRKTEAGIFIPTSAGQEGSQQIGDVLAVGSGFYKESGEFIRNLNVKVGDKVIYGKYAGIDCVLNGESVRLMQEIDVLGIVIDDKETK